MKKIIVILVYILATCPGLKTHAGQQQDKEQFNVVVNLGYEVNSIDLTRDSLNFETISAVLMAKVNELTKNKKISVVFANIDKKTNATINIPDNPNLYFNVSILFNSDLKKTGVDVFYAEDNDFTFQSIKYANMVVSEIRGSKLNLKVNGMIESDLPGLKSAMGPALQVDINLMNTPSDKLILTNEDKLNALAKLIYECIERISKS